MPPLINNLLILFIGLFGLIIIFEFIKTRVFRAFLCQAGSIIVVVFLFRIVFGFPEAEISFGGMQQLTIIFIMLICATLGIVAHHIFMSKRKFSWRAVIKSSVVTPIVLLPLLGSIQSTSVVEPVQYVSFGFLAFQNGFFWRIILANVAVKK